VASACMATTALAAGFGYATMEHRTDASVYVDA
jgi:hypothetical protein